MSDAPKIAGKKKIYAYIWFDVEDYVTPESNDVPLKAIRILKKYNVPVTTKLVAEKLRFMKKLHRSDVISAISNYCDIGYHSNTHSRHPLVYEYVGNLNVKEGAKEIAKRERPGLEELRRAFRKVPSCFGHAGSQWCPHYYPHLKNVGIRVYMDATDIVNIDDSPYWYCGVLNLNNADKNYIRFDRIFEKPDGIRKLKKRLATILSRLERNPKGGAISILWHPHTAVNRVYWDTVNFSNGRNPPKGRRYVRPEQYPVEIKERAIQDFEDFARFGSTFKDVRFISATDAAGIYLRRLEFVLESSRIVEVARAINRSRGRISFIKLGDDYVSPSQAFSALVNFASAFSKSGKIPGRTLVSEPLGPMALFKSKTRRNAKIPLEDFLSANQHVSKDLARHGCIPTSIWISKGVDLEPSDFLATLAPVIVTIASIGKFKGGTIPLRRARMILGEKYVNETAFKRACLWGILPKGFRAPKILEQAKLQAWTLVPAVARES